MKPSAFRLLIFLFAAMAVVAIIRNAVIRYELEKPGSGSAFALGDPRLAIGRGMRAIDAAAAQGRPPSPTTIRAVVGATRGAPLEPEPFLVAGIAAGQAGDGTLAEKLFLAAKARDPRSLATRYLLADHYSRSGDRTRAMDEMAAMLRLQDRVSLDLAPYFVRLAREPGGSALLERLFRENPAYARQLLPELANQAVPAGVVLELGRTIPKSPSDRAWQGNLLRAMIRRGEVSAAKALWLRFAGVPAPGPLLFDPQFANRSAPEPFIWSYSATADGVAEPGEDGTLSILYYGRNEVILASHTLALAPDSYRLSWQAKGSAVNQTGLAWTVRCDGTGAVLAEGGVATGGLAWFVADTCPVQRLELIGRPSDGRDDRSLTISHLSLERRP